MTDEICWVCDECGWVGEWRPDDAPDRPPIHLSPEDDVSKRRVWCGVPAEAVVRHD